MYYINDTNVAHFAHWNGMVNGFLMGLILYKVIPTYKNNIRRVSGLFYITLNFLYIINYFNWPPKYGYELDYHEETCCEQWYSVYKKILITKRYMSNIIFYYDYINARSKNKIF